MKSSKIFVCRKFKSLTFSFFTSIFHGSFANQKVFIRMLHNFILFSLLGSDGLPGPRGSLGPNGFDGPVGEKGDAGDRGFIGIPGPDGTLYIFSCLPPCHHPNPSPDI